MLLTLANAGPPCPGGSVGNRAGLWPECPHRLTARTSGFHPGNRGSIPRGDAI